MNSDNKTHHNFDVVLQDISILEKVSQYSMMNKHFFKNHTIQIGLLFGMQSKMASDTGQKLGRKKQLNVETKVAISSDKNEKVAMQRHVESTSTKSSQPAKIPTEIKVINFVFKELCAL